MYYNNSETAAILGIALVTLWRLQKRYNLKPYKNPKNLRYVYYSQEQVDFLKNILSGTVFIQEGTDVQQG